MTDLSSFLRSDLSKSKHFTYMILSNDLVRCWIKENTKYVGILRKWVKVRDVIDNAIDPHNLVKATILTILIILDLF